MDIQSVTSNVSAYANTASQPSQTQQVQQAERRERVEFTEEAPRPVKNAQGQETGRLINVIA